MDTDRRMRSTRYPGLDVLRGIALISMVSLHVSDGQPLSYLGRILHSARWIDGAFFFVALSGLVTGLVHRRLVDRAGAAASRVKLVRRAGFLYGVHIALGILVIGMNTVRPGAAIPLTPTWSTNPGPLGNGTALLMLHLEPDANNVLPMYVFFLLWAVVAVQLISKRRYAVVIALSVTMYVAGQITGGVVLAPGSFELASWQLLFTAGLLIGWSWEHERLSFPPTLRRCVIGAAAVLSVGLLTLTRVAPSSVDHLPWSPVSKFAGGWLSFLFAGAVLILGYALIDWLYGYAWPRRVMVPVAIAGSKGLPGYVAMMVAVLVLQTLPWVHRNDIVVALVVLVCGTTELSALKFAAWRRRRAQAMSASRTGLSPADPQDLAGVV